MFVLNVEQFHGGDTHYMAVGPFSSAELADRYFLAGGFADHEDYCSHEILVVNRPSPGLFAKAVLNLIAEAN